MIKVNQKQSFIGGAIALLLATSCCWLPLVIIGLGGASAGIAFSAKLNQLVYLFTPIAIGLLTYGAYLFWKKKKNDPMQKDVVLQSTITCPECGHQSEETMPTNACQFFYECKNCQEILKPKKGDCCVYCSFGTVKCPPIQLNQDCC